jgi:hypothetical protein
VSSASVPVKEADWNVNSLPSSVIVLASSVLPPVTNWTSM